MTSPRPAMRFLYGHALESPAAPMSEGGSVSLGLAFAAGVVSFLSPCVLPLVPSYVTYVSGVTLDELAGPLGAPERRAARRQAAVHAGAFVLGFLLLFTALGATATALGVLLHRVLPLLQRLGGVVLVAFGLYLLGVLRLSMLQRERRLHLASKPAGVAGSFVVGLAFGAGWTPCVGPILASILLYAGTQETVARGMILLATYAVGLGIPFLAAAVGLSWYLAGVQRLRRWLRPIEIAAGGLLVLVGALLLTGRFSALSSFLAGFGQLVNLS